MAFSATPRGLTRATESCEAPARIQFRCEARAALPSQASAAVATTLVDRLSMEAGCQEPTHIQVLIVLRQQNEPVTVSTLGSLLNAWKRQEHLGTVLADLLAAGKVSEQGGGWVAE